MRPRTKAVPLLSGFLVERGGVSRVGRITGISSAEGHFEGEEKAYGEARSRCWTGSDKVASWGSQKVGRGDSGDNRRLQRFQARDFPPSAHPT